MPSLSALAPLAGIISSIPSVIAGFDPTSQSNVAVYWGELARTSLEVSANLVLTQKRAKLIWTGLWSLCSATTLILLSK